jgi:hypothetical protein
VYQSTSTEIVTPEYGSELLFAPQYAVLCCKLANRRKVVNLAQTQILVTVTLTGDNFYEIFEKTEMV